VHASPVGGVPATSPQGGTDRQIHPLGRYFGFTKPLKDAGWALYEEDPDSLALGQPRHEGMAQEYAFGDLKLGFREIASHGTLDLCPAASEHCLCRS
jgi:hypothetical protein